MKACGFPAIYFVLLLLLFLFQDSDWDSVPVAQYYPVDMQLLFECMNAYILFSINIGKKNVGI